jgi:8-oxo-dGTP pyrophosphatase MutT (NUDIX family)
MTLVLELIMTYRQEPHLAQSNHAASTRGRQLVAAVCFRLLSTGVEFLLVRTRRGRWTFPKGGVDAGLTQAQSAALEAYEEAGVHGRMEEIAFTRYSSRKAEHRDTKGADIIHAHLCEVVSHDPPQELHRNPTWFSSERTKRQLAQARSPESAAELARVVDRAVARVRRLPFRPMLSNDPLFRVQFEVTQTNPRYPELHARSSTRRPSSHIEHGAVSNSATGSVSGCPEVRRNGEEPSTLVLQT